MPHLPPDRVRRLFAPRYRRRQTGRAQGRLELFEDALHQVAAFTTQEVEARQYGLTPVAVQFGEGHVLELGLHVLHTDALRQGSVDVHGLQGDPPPLLGVVDEMQCAHVVQAIGQLDQQDPDVLGHGQHELA